MSLRDVVLSHKLFTRTRLYSLYSDFTKLKQINPEGYEANLIAWKSLISQIFTHSQLPNTFTIDTEGLLDELTLAEYGKPMALHLVLEDLVATGDLMPLRQFQDRVDGVYDRQYVKPMLKWAVNRFIWDLHYKLTDGKTLKKDTLVNIKILELFETKLWSLIQDDETLKHVKLVFTKEEFKRLINKYGIKLDDGTVTLTDSDYTILLKYLERDVKRISIKKDIIKIGVEITDEDIGICQIKSTIDSINLQIQQLQDKIDSIDLNLQQTLKTNSKEVSLNLLRSKKLAQKSMTRQISCLNQLESTMYKINESSNNLQLINALEKGSLVLKSLHSQIGGLDKVESLIDDIQEESYKSDKINQEINRLDTQFDQEEIDQEFEKLLQQERAKLSQQQEEEEAKLPIKQSESESTDDVSKKLEKLSILPNEIKEKKQSSPSPLLNN